jgi:hypothetical protein
MPPLPSPRFLARAVAALVLAVALTIAASSASDWLTERDDGHAAATVRQAMADRARYRAARDSLAPLRAALDVRKDSIAALAKRVHQVDRTHVVADGVVVAVPEPVAALVGEAVAIVAPLTLYETRVDTVFVRADTALAADSVAIEAERPSRLRRVFSAIGRAKTPVLVAGGAIIGWAVRGALTKTANRRTSVDSHPPSPGPGYPR